MNIGTALLLLLGAALLEAGGDAIVRTGLHSAGGTKSVLLILLGGAVLLAYGCLVNAPPWDFGKLLGVYVVLFFVVSQIIAWTVFGQPPTLPIAFGGFLIIAGGLVISLWRT